MIGTTNTDLAEKVVSDSISNKKNLCFIDFSKDYNNPSTWPQKRKRNIKRLADNNNLSFVFHSDFRIPLAALHEKCRIEAVKSVKQEIEIASFLNSPIIVHPSAHCSHDHQKPLDRIQSANKLIESITELCAFSQCPIWLENLVSLEPGSLYESTFSDIASINYIMSSTKIPWAFDVGHAFLSGGSILNTMEKYLSRIACVILHDNNLVHDQHLFPGSGKIEFGCVFDVIRNNNWQGTVLFDSNQVDRGNIQRRINGFLSQHRMFPNERETNIHYPLR